MTARPRNAALERNRVTIRATRRGSCTTGRGSASESWPWPSSLPAAAGHLRWTAATRARAAAEPGSGDSTERRRAVNRARLDRAAQWRGRRKAAAPAWRHRRDRRPGRHRWIGRRRRRGGGTGAGAGRRRGAGRNRWHGGNRRYGSPGPGTRRYGRHAADWARRHGRDVRNRRPGRFGGGGPGGRGARRRGSRRHAAAVESPVVGRGGGRAACGTGGGVCLTAARRSCRSRRGTSSTTPRRNEIYASVSGDAEVYANTIVVVDPTTSSVVSTIPIGSNPGKLALSDDGSTLWVGIDGAHAIRKVTLTSTPPVVGPLLRLRGRIRPAISMRSRWSRCRARRCRWRSRCRPARTSTRRGPRVRRRRAARPSP